MPLDVDKILADLNKLAKPKLEEVAQRMQDDFKKRFGDFMEDTDLTELDNLLKKAAGYEVEAITCEDRSKADQWAEAAQEVLRQISMVLITEKIVAQREFAALIETAALAVFDGLKEVALAMVGVAVKGAVAGLMGGEGGGLAEAAGDFLG